jgi:hypothetical protein
LVGRGYQEEDELEKLLLENGTEEEKVVFFRDLSQKRKVDIRRREEEKRWVNFPCSTVQS